VRVVGICDCVLLARRPDGRIGGLLRCASRFVVLSGEGLLSIQLLELPGDYLILISRSAYFLDEHFARVRVLWDATRLLLGCAGDIERVGFHLMCLVAFGLRVLWCWDMGVHRVGGFVELPLRVI